MAYDPLTFNVKEYVKRCMEVVLDDEPQPAFVEPVKVETEPKKSVFIPTTGSKKNRAIAIVNQMLTDAKSRKEIIAALVSTLNMTETGASTYFSNIKAKRPGWI